MLQKRVAEIALINVDRIPRDRAGFGSTLHVVEENGEKLVFQLVMPEDADAAKGLISTTSPIGRAFLNKEPGDTVKVVDARRHARVRDRQAPHHSRRSTRMTRTERGCARPHVADPYSPQRRTALVLTGTGTAGAYHAGVLRALHEAGVKIDSSPAAASAWSARCSRRSTARSGCGTTRASGAPRPCIALPVALRTAAGRLGAGAGAGDRRGADRGRRARPDRLSRSTFVLKMVGCRRRSGPRQRLPAAAEAAFAPEALPTWLPRLVLLVLGDGRRRSCWSTRGAATGAAAAAARSGGAWCRRAALVAASAVDHTWRVMWDLVRGATQLKQPSTAELGRRYTELLAENLGQPGFRELLDHRARRRRRIAIWCSRWSREPRRREMISARHQRRRRRAASRGVRSRRRRPRSPAGRRGRRR